LAGSLWSLHRIVERLEESLADSAEMTEVMLRQPNLADPAHPQDFRTREGHIELKNVHFYYEDSGTDPETLFADLSLKIAPGEKVGLVGPSGGGKSTLTKLLLRFMDVQSGAILVDGRDIREVSQDALRTHIAYVPQEPILFHRTIRENILYGDPAASEEMVIKAAKLAHAHDFIMQLPQGYETLVGERGVKLSGGEKQRVAIARAMLKTSPVLILDEATSALDSKSEKAIVGALDNLMKNRTTIVIAHRLSTIRKLDRVLVLKGGRIVEDGSHESLQKKVNGIYADLWRHQSDSFLAE
jgi:ATP-binding cassette subfamily B protein